MINNKGFEKTYFTNYQDVPLDQKFSRNAIYRVYNRKTKVEHLANGEQVEGLLDNTEDYIIKFYWYFEIIDRKREARMAELEAEIKQKIGEQ